MHCCLAVKADKTRLTRQGWQRLGGESKHPGVPLQCHDEGVLAEQERHSAEAFAGRGAWQRRWALPRREWGGERDHQTSVQVARGEKKCRWQASQSVYSSSEGAAYLGAMSFHSFYNEEAAAEVSGACGSGCQVAGAWGARPTPRLFHSQRRSTPRSRTISPTKAAAMIALMYSEFFRITADAALPRREPR